MPPSKQICYDFYWCFLHQFLTARK